MYRRKYHHLILPIIVLSTITGAVNIGMQSLVPTAAILYTQLGTGLLNLSVGIMTTLLNFFSYAQKTQAHLATAGMWFKLYRRISTELAIHCENRSHANDFFDSIKKEYEVISEQAPEIDAHTLREFKKKFADQMRVRHNLDERDIDHLSAYFDSAGPHLSNPPPPSSISSYDCRDPESASGVSSTAADTISSEASEPAILDSLHNHRLLMNHRRERPSRGPEFHVPMIAQPFVPTPIYQNHIREYRDRRRGDTRPYMVTEMMVATLTPTPSVAGSMSNLRAVPSSLAAAHAGTNADADARRRLSTLASAQSVPAPAPAPDHGSTSSARPADDLDR
jgi:hypothetical protein